MVQKKSLLMIIIIIVLVYQAGCSASFDQEEIDASTSVLESSTTTVLPATSNAMTVTPTVLERVSATITPTMTSTNGVEITPTTQPQNEETNSKCLDSEPEIVIDTPLATGLMLRDTGPEKVGVSIVGLNGLDEPAFFFADAVQNLIFPSASPDRNRFVDDLIVSSEGERSLKKAVIVNLNNGQNINKFFEDVDNLPFDAKLSWINNMQLAIRLQNENELFKWLIWSPTDDIEEVISVNLEGIGEAIQKYNVLPTIDPSVKYIIYPCENCDIFEYQTINLETGIVEWGIDLGQNTSINYWGLPTWSPDGKYIAITNSNFGEAELWVLNRQGEIVYTVNLPEVDGIVGGGFISWSPNSQYLAFSRNNLTSGIKKPTLSYLDTESGLTVDLCIETKANMPLWSPDNSKLVFTRQTEPGEPLHVITIVNIITEEVVQLNDRKGHLIVGWMNLAQPEP